MNTAPSPTRSHRATSLPGLSLRMLVRDARSGELNLLLAALVIAAASLSTVGFFADRVQRGLAQQSATLLGADRLLSSAQPLPSAWTQRAHDLGLRSTRTLDFRSVVLPVHGQDGAPQLVEVKAVEAGYPLLGQLRIANAPFVPGHTTTAIPAPGTVWVAGRLLPRLGLKVGERLTLGAVTLRIAHVLAQEPDRAGAVFSLAPRVLMNRADLPASRLLGPGSRAQYHLLLAGPPRALRRFHTALATPAGLPAGLRWRSTDNARPALRQALERAHQFLGLTALISVLLAGLAVAMTVRRFVSRHLDTAAVLRSLGVERRALLSLFGLEMLWLGLGAGVLGAALGFVGQAGLYAVLGQILSITLPAPGAHALFGALGIALITLLGFGLPPLLALGRVPPARVLRRELAPPPPHAWGVYGLALASLGGIAAWQIGTSQLLLWFFGATALTLAVLAAAGTLGLALLGWLRRVPDNIGHRGAGRFSVAARFGLRGLLRRPGTSLAQILALGLGLMALILLALVRNDLLAGWQHSLPRDTPNYFLINIQPDQLKPLRQTLARQGLPVPQLYPMIRGRLLAINGRAVHPGAYTDPRAQRLAARDFNLSWAAHPQTGNRIVAGQWWDAPSVRDKTGTGAAPDITGTPPLSLETGIAQTLGIHLGDTLRFEIAGQPLQVRVSNLRRVDWASFRVNFFAVLPPGALRAYPATWITRFYLPPARQPLLAQLVAQFPNITVIDVAALLGQVQQLIRHVTLAVQFLFGFTLLAGLAVLYAALQAQQDERRYEAAVLRTFGASRRLLITGLAVEFTALGALAGLLGGLAASAIAHLLARQVFHFNLAFNPEVALGGLLLGALGVGLAGLLGTRNVWRRPPLRTLGEHVH